MQRATTHRRLGRRVGTQRGGVLNDPAARKRGRNANNGNNGGPPPQPPQPPAAAPDSAFERALDASPPITDIAQFNALKALLEAETWRTHFSADVVVKIVRLNVNLMVFRNAGQREPRFDTPEQWAEITKAVITLALAPSPPTGGRQSDLETLLDATGNNMEKIGRDPVTWDTPLHVVVRANLLWSTKVLCKHGADLWAKNRQEQSPALLAMTSPDRGAFVRMFLETGQLKAEGSFRRVLAAFPERGELVRHGIVLVMRYADESVPTITDVMQYVTPEMLELPLAQPVGTLLHLASALMLFGWIGALLDRGASANATTPNTLQRLPLNYFLIKSALENAETQTPGFKTALQRLVDSTSVEGLQSVLAKKHRGVPAHVLVVLEAALEARLPPKPKWEGWTQGDAEAFDRVFEPEHALNFTACPVCLCSVERSDACNYMGHNCKAQPGFYHKGLYEKYQEQGIVHWCTNCGRIATAAHQHYELESAGAKRRPLTFPSVDPFGHQCYPDGGGDLPEKVARFRRLREYALEMQEDVGKITEQKAKEQLVEEMWNAPLARSRAATLVAASKTWNIPSDKFPTRKAEAAVEAEAVASGPAPDVRKPAADAALTPVRVLQALNAWSREEVAEGVRFVHRKTDGTVNAHEGDVIGVESLAEVLQARLAATGVPEFGFCWGYPACSARLYPEDVQPFVPVDLYEAYRVKFNEKFRGATGGGKRRGTSSHHHRGGGGLRVTSDAEGGLLQPLKDGQCALPPPPKQGGGTRAKGRRVQARHTRRKVR